jgi:spore germination cell wall hydrolase CwlJ-like protein
MVMANIIKFLLCVALLVIAVLPAPGQDFHQTDIDASELRCMELNIHYEARGESYTGKQAVANVTINRMVSGKFPDTVCTVVYQPWQFSWVKLFPKHHHTVVTDQDIKNIARNALISSVRFADVTKGALYFHNREVEPFRRKSTVIIGNHIFYK